MKRYCNSILLIACSILICCCNSRLKETYLPETEIVKYFVPDYSTFQWKFNADKDSLIKLFGKEVYEKHAASLSEGNKFINEAMGNDSTLSTVGLDGYTITLFRGIKIKEEYNRDLSKTKLLDSSFTIIHLPYNSKVWDSLKTVSQTPDLVERLRESCK